MSSASVYAVLFAVVLYVSLWQTYDADTFPAVREIDEKACKDIEGVGRKYVSGTKKRPQSCEVNCKFDDNSTQLVFLKDGTECCDVGVMQTGTCKNGTCPIGNGMI